MCSRMERRKVVTVGQDPISLGSSKQYCNVVLYSNERIGEHHANIYQEDGKAFIAPAWNDCEIWVNHKIIQGATSLTDGTVINIGSVRITYDAVLKSSAAPVTTCETKTLEAEVKDASPIADEPLNDEVETKTVVETTTVATTVEPLFIKSGPLASSVPPINLITQQDTSGLKLNEPEPLSLIHI